MNHKESKLQSECVRWFRYQYPNLLLFAIPNGGKRNLITAAILKREGVVIGVADLFLAHGCKANGLFIEMKVGNCQQSEAQREFQKKITSFGYAYVICRSFDEFKREIEHYLS